VIASLRDRQCGRFKQLSAFFDQISRTKGLAQKNRKAEFIKDALINLQPFGRAEENRKIPEVCHASNGGDKFKPGHPRHLAVCDKQVGGSFVHHPQHFATFCRGSDGISCASQVESNHILKHAIVFCHYDLPGHKLLLITVKRHVGG
jgi:hypothetical protein